MTGIIDDTHITTVCDWHVHGAELRGIIERIETLEAEKSEIAEQVKDVYAEAKGNGFDPKILREVIRLRKKTADERSEAEAMLDLYMQALGMAS